MWPLSVTRKQQSLCDADLTDTRCRTGESPLASRRPVDGLHPPRTHHLAGSIASAWSASSGHGAPLTCAAICSAHRVAVVKPREPRPLCSHSPAWRRISRGASTRAGRGASGSGAEPTSGQRSGAAARQPTPPCRAVVSFKAPAPIKRRLTGAQRRRSPLQRLRGAAGHAPRAPAHHLAARDPGASAPPCGPVCADEMKVVGILRLL